MTLGTDDLLGWQDSIGEEAAVRAARVVEALVWGRG